MDVQTIRKYIGRKVLLILKNNFQYTTVIPEFNGTSFSIMDKFGATVDVECDYISFIKEVGGYNGGR